MVVRLGILFVTGAGAGEEEVILQQVQTLLREVLPVLLLLQQRTLPSERYLIEESLRRWCDEEEIDLVITVGGTFPALGPGGDEIVPEATASVLERPLPSLPETMRAHALAEEPMAILDRGVAGIRGRSLVMNLPAGLALSTLFLEGVVDLLPLLLARLQPPSASRAHAPSDPSREAAEEQGEPEETPSPAHGLDPDEFAAFVRNRRQQ